MKITHRLKNGRISHDISDLKKGRGSMRIEDMTISFLKKTLEKSNESEIKKLRHRFITLYWKFFKEKKDASVIFKSMGEEFTFTRRDLYRKYHTVIEEMKKRGMTYNATELDGIVMKRRLAGIDLDSITTVPVIKNCVIIFHHKNEGMTVSFALPTVEDYDKTSESLAEILKNEIGKSVEIVRTYDGKEGKGLGIYDLVLIPKEALEKVSIKSEREYICKYCGDEAKWVYSWDDKKEFVPVCHKERLKAKAEFLDSRGQELQVVPIKKLKEKADKKEVTVKKLDLERKEHLVLLEDPRRYTGFHRSYSTDLHGDDGLPADVAVIFANRKLARDPMMGHGFEDENRVAFKFPVDKYPSKESVEDVMRKVDIHWGVFFPSGSSHEDIATYYDRDRMEGPILRFEIKKIEKAKKLVGGIVYEPDTKDTHGDWTDTEEIEKAMHKFMEKYSDDNGKLKVMHKGKDYGFPIIENFQPEQDTKKGDQVIKKGAWWLMIKVTDDTIWKAVEDGTLTGFSMGGTARKQ